LRERRPWTGLGRESAIFAWASVGLAATVALSLISAQLWPWSTELGGQTLSLAQGSAGDFFKAFVKDLSKGWYLFWPLLLSAGLGRLTAGERSRVLGAWLVAFGVFSVIGVVQFYTGWPRPQPIPTHPGRFHATLLLGHHLSVASVWIFPFFAALDLLQVFPRPGRRRIALAVAVGFGLITLFLTYSRMLWVALPVGLLGWLLWSLPRRWAIPGILAAGLAGASLFALEPVRERLRNPMGVGTRQNLWSAHLELFADRPLTGVGWRRNQEASGWVLRRKSGSPQVFSGHAHNNVIDQLSGTGALGLLAWLAWWGVLAWLAVGVLGGAARGAFAAEEWVFAKGLVCAWVVFQLNGLTQVNFWEGKVLHQLAWTTGWLLLWARQTRQARSVVEGTDRSERETVAPGVALPGRFKNDGVPA
jgi:O-antigen ligase